MTITIDLEKEKPPLGDLVEQMLVGVEVVLTKGERPVAKLVAIPPRAARQFGSARGLIEVGEDFDEPLDDFPGLDDLRYLLDSHTLLWFLAGASKLSDKARRIIEHPDHDILASIASLWEIGIKHSLGKLNLHRPFAEIIPHHLEINSIAILGVRVDHVRTVTTLPFHHRDPFDRILVAQALVEEIPIVSCDDALDLYGVERIW